MSSPSNHDELSTTKNRSGQILIGFLKTESANRRHKPFLSRKVTLIQNNIFHTFDILKKLNIDPLGPVESMYTVVIPNLQT